jgi:alkaline phosphatase D
MDTIPPRHKVTLSEAHIGNLEIDTKLLDSYGLLPDNVREFYLQARAVFSGSSDIDFTNPQIIEIAQKCNLSLMSGPMLGNLSENGVTLWLRPSYDDPLVVRLTKIEGSAVKSYTKNSIEPGVEQRIVIDGLDSDTEYKYAVYVKERRIAEGRFATAPAVNKKEMFRLTFGSCFHKIGLHNPNLIYQILARKPQAMMLLGDIAVDDRENRINMHRSDYLLRDVSKSWRLLSANVPLYAVWDDHDYLNNDLGGVPEGFTDTDREAVRAVWQQNWNNPENEKQGIYFNTRIGPVEMIMLDTRSFRENNRQGKYGSYLGTEQLIWLKDVLKKSKAPFKVISGGTMWSDYITNGKDSWGVWDVEAREEIFNFIETENISGVLLISGDRHGARGFTIPRPSGFAFYEFEAGSLGGVPGPDAFAEDTTNQLFGYYGTDEIAFGEFTFETKDDQPFVIFKLINEFGKILEEHTIPYSKLTPQKK